MGPYSSCRRFHALADLRRGTLPKRKSFLRRKCRGELVKGHKQRLAAASSSLQPLWPVHGGSHQSGTVLLVQCGALADLDAPVVLIHDIDALKEFAAPPHAHLSSSTPRSC